MYICMHACMYVCMQQMGGASIVGMEMEMEKGMGMGMEAVLERGRSLLASVASLSPLKVSPSCSARLSKLILGELRFLRRVSSAQRALSPILSGNLLYLEAIVQILEHPDVDAVTALLQTFPILATEEEVHVDVVCTFRGQPTWFVVSCRNPKHLSWDEGAPKPTWRSRVNSLLIAAICSTLLRPNALIFCFARGLSQSFIEKLTSQYVAFEVENFELHVANNPPPMKYRESSDTLFCEVEGGEWVDIIIEKGMMKAFQIHIQPRDEYERPNISILNQGMLREVGSSGSQIHLERPNELLLYGFHKDEDLVSLLCKLKTSNSQYLSGKNHNGDDNGDVNKENGMFDSLLTCFNLGQSSGFEDGKDRPGSLHLVNLDTTAMVAMVSDLSNGGAQMLREMSREELREKFRSRADFMKEQAMSEIEKPLLPELIGFLQGKQPFISQCACKEFLSLVTVNGGASEKLRAGELLKVLLVLPDSPSKRVISLDDTRGINKKNKVIFGTGDFWHSSTLTANMTFVRAVRQIGMTLAAIEHRPRALVGEKGKHN